MLAILAERHQDRGAPNGESDCLCGGRVFHIQGTHAVSLQAVGARSRDCDTSFGADVTTAFAGSTDRTDRTGKVSGPCESAYVIPNGVERSMRKHKDRT